MIVEQNIMATSESQIEYESYFPEIDFGSADLALTAYVYARVSIFDHWLTEQEADVNKILCYSLAVKEGATAEYFDGEMKFLKLYRSLSSSYVICKHPGPLRRLDLGDPELEHVIVNSLRENRFMDVYFIAERIRVVGCYDRTDLVLFENEGDLDAFHVKVKEAGLFLLR
jgi:hypothetical protein